jgi:hypothetical protein
MSRRMSKEPGGNNEATFALTDEAEARALLREAAALAHPVAWTSGLAAGNGRLEQRGERTFVVDDTGRPMRGSVRVAFVLHGVPLFAELSSTGVRAGTDLGMWSTEKRATRRMRANIPSDVRWWSFEGHSPRSRSAELVDLGGGGARLFVPHGSALPQRDSSFPVSIAIGGESLECMAEVRNETTTREGIEIGVALHAAADRDRLADFCARMFMPQVKLRREVDQRNVCDLFELSGYLGLRPSLSPREDWLHLDADSISRDMVYVSESGQAIGHVSITRAYTNTWLGHQIAMHPRHDEGLTARRNLYLGFATMPTLIDGIGTRLIGFYNRERPWHQVFFEHFASSVGAADRVVVAPWDRYELSAVGAQTSAGPGVEIGDATPGDLGLLTLVAREALPPLVADALDLTPMALVAPALHPAYRRNRIGRSRKVLVLREHGEVTAFALTELSHRSLSLFNMMNVAQFFGVPGRGSTAGKAALVAAVLAHYRSCGVEQPTIVAPHRSFDASAHPALRFEETMGSIVWTGPALRAYENYVQLRFGWLERGIRFDAAATRGAA